MKKYLYILFSLFGLACFSSCSNVLEDENLGTICETNTNGNGDLIISMNLPALDIESRSIAGDPKNAADNWTTWEKYCDGALLYRVTLFVVDSLGTLVAYRDFYSGSGDIQPENSEFGGNGFYKDEAVDTASSNGIAVKATFKAKYPLHGPKEMLQTGKYTVYAVANYSAITSDDNIYNGLGSASEDGTGTDVYNGVGGDFTTIVTNITTTFKDSENGIANFRNSTTGKPFFEYQLNSGIDRVCKMQPQPLVMIREVELTNNASTTLNGLLARTFARIRLTVKNTDATAMIGVSALSFNGAYASKYAYLFNDVAANPTTANLYAHFALYATSGGQLTVSSEDAIIPFESTMKRLVAGTAYNIFDCYILEGMIEADYAFQFTATHWTSGTSGSSTANYRIESWDGSGNDEYGLLDFMVYVRKTTNASDYYIMEAVPTIVNDVVTGGFMKVSTTSVTESKEGSTTPLAPQYVWEIQPTETQLSSKEGTANGQFFSIGYSLYLQAYDGDNDYTPKLAYSKSPTELYFKINFSGQDEKGTIFCQYDGYWYYINSTTGLWTKGSTINTSLSNISSYEKLLFGTIPGQAGSAATESITQPIVMSSSGTTGKNQVVRNDFFWGTIPVKVN